MFDTNGHKGTPSFVEVGKIGLYTVYEYNMGSNQISYIRVRMSNVSMRQVWIKGIYTTNPLEA